MNEEVVMCHVVIDHFSKRRFGVRLSKLILYFVVWLSVTGGSLGF